MPKQENDFLAYYQQFKDKIFNYFWYRVNFNNSLAEDLTSEVFLKAFEKFETFDQERPFQAWIYTVARNHLYNHYRIMGREVKLDEAQSVFYEPQNTVDTGIELDRVMEKINGLDAYHRDVLLMRFVDGLDNAEIAGLLGKEEGAVRTQISRAMNKLKEIL